MFEGSLIKINNCLFLSISAYFGIFPIEKIQFTKSKKKILHLRDFDFQIKPKFVEFFFCFFFLFNFSYIFFEGMHLQIERKRGMNFSLSKKQLLCLTQNNKFEMNLKKS